MLVVIRRIPMKLPLSLIFISRLTGVDRHAERHRFGKCVGAMPAPVFSPFPAASHEPDAQELLFLH